MEELSVMEMQAIVGGSDAVPIDVTFVVVGSKVINVLPGHVKPAIPNDPSLIGMNVQVLHLTMDL